MKRTAIPAIAALLAALASSCTTAKGSPRAGTAPVTAPVVVRVRALDAGAYSDYANFAKWEPRRGLMTMSVDPSWDEGVRTNQLAIAVANGYLPLEIVGENLEDDFVRSVKKVTREDDVFRLEWIQFPKVIRLDRTKLVNYFVASGAIEAVTGLVLTNEQFADWYANKMTYVRGSADAVAFSLLLGLTQDQLEALVLQCRETE